MFEKATRIKARFESSKGLLSVEDLWDLPLTSTTNKPSLNEVAKIVAKQIKEEGEVDFVNDSTLNNTLLQLKLDIVKHIIAVRREEAEAAKQRALKAAQKERILEVIAKKQDEKLEGLSLDELQAMVTNL